MESELASFLAFARSFPNNFICLVDTYDTLTSGVPNFLCVAFALQKAGFKRLGVRLDSGNLAKLSIYTKMLFKECGKRIN